MNAALQNFPMWVHNIKVLQCLIIKQVKFLRYQ